MAASSSLSTRLGRTATMSDYRAAILFTTNGIEKKFQEMMKFHIGAAACLRIRTLTISGATTIDPEIGMVQKRTELHDYVIEQLSSYKKVIMGGIATGVIGPLRLDLRPYDALAVSTKEADVRDQIDQLVNDLNTIRKEYVALLEIVNQFNNYGKEGAHLFVDSPRANALSSSSSSSSSSSASLVRVTSGTNSKEVESINAISSMIEATVLDYQSKEQKPPMKEMDRLIAEVDRALGSLELVLNAVTASRPIIEGTEGFLEKNQKALPKDLYENLARFFKACNEADKKIWGVFFKLCQTTLKQFKESGCTQFDQTALMELKGYLSHQRALKENLELESAKLPYIDGGETLPSSEATEKRKIGEVEAKKMGFLVYVEKGVVTVEEPPKHSSASNGLGLLKAAQETWVSQNKETVKLWNRPYIFSHEDTLTEYTTKNHLVLAGRAKLKDPTIADSATRLLVSEEQIEKLTIDIHLVTSFYKNETEKTAVKTLYRQLNPLQQISAQINRIMFDLVERVDTIENLHRQLEPIDIQCAVATPIDFIEQVELFPAYKEMKNVPASDYIQNGVVALREFHQRVREELGAPGAFRSDGIQQLHMGYKSVWVSFLNSCEEFLTRFEKTGYAVWDKNAMERLKATSKTVVSLETKDRKTNLPRDLYVLTEGAMPSHGQEEILTPGEVSLRGKGISVFMRNKEVVIGEAIQKKKWKDAGCTTSKELVQKILEKWATENKELIKREMQLHLYKKDQKITIFETDVSIGGKAIARPKADRISERKDEYEFQESQLDEFVLKVILTKRYIRSGDLHGDVFDYYHTIQFTQPYEQKHKLFFAKTLDYFEKIKVAFDAIEEIE